MCRAMRASNRFILCPLLLVSPVLGAVAGAPPDDDRVAAYLREHDMLALLEAQLEQRIDDAQDEQQRAELAQELSLLYLRQLRATKPDEPYRQLLLLKASALVSRMAQAPMHELRLELLIDAYIRVEPDVEYFRLGLLSPQQTEMDIATLAGIGRGLDAITAVMEPELERETRRVSRGSQTAPGRGPASVDQLRRLLSLAHYYQGWSGYSLATLGDEHAPAGVFIAFGWLLGAQGSTPSLDGFNASTLEYEHVARAAIGLALAYAQSDDAITGRAWAKRVAESELVSEDVRRAAQDRLLQIYAMDRDWTQANQYARQLVIQRGQGAHLSAADARFLALRALGALGLGDIGTGGATQAMGTAEFAVEQLIALGEIGHVVDLYHRFDSLPQITDGFIPSYAHALAELNRAEQASDAGPGRYISVADLFDRAARSQDAGDYPQHREDCLLKLAYAQIQANRPSEALTACEQIIKGSVRQEAIEEARWMQIAALDRLNTNKGRDGSPELSAAVLRYIEAYPATPRSAKLILRYAMQGTIDPRVAIATLEAIDDADPIAVPARRTLIQLHAKALRAGAYRDQDLLGRTLDLVVWILDAQGPAPSDLNQARAQMGTIRTGLDLALRAVPPRTRLAQSLLERGSGLLGFDHSLEIYRAEFVYRQIQLALLDGRTDDASDLLGQLTTLDPRLGDNARLLLLNRFVENWQAQRTPQTARSICDLGAQVLASMTPPHPEALGLQVSTIAELIGDAAQMLWERDRDQTPMRDLALRVSKMVLDRGEPSEAGLRRTAALASSTGDGDTELEAWLRLLAAYPEDDERWYEARYESLRVMHQSDPDRAQRTFAQYRVLHPDLGPEPWASRIADLFGLPVPPIPAQIPGGGTP